ncbi:hypothetical protein D3C84_699780 [compost metagenome]
MVVEAVAHLIVGDVLRRIGNPMQHLHAIAAGAGIDHVKDFPGATMTADFHAGQVPHLAVQCAGIGSGCTDFAQALAAAVVDVTFIVILAVFADHWAHGGQLIAQVPGERLTCFQLTQVAVGIETGSQFGFGRRSAITFGQATVAVPRAGQGAAMGLCAGVHQIQ